MDTNKILSADLLDLIFDDRNKEYGAYELRKTYQRRVTKSLVFTGLFVAVTFTGVVLANKLTPKESSKLSIDTVTISNLIPEVEQPEPLPEPPPRQPEPQPIQTERFTQIAIVDDADVVDPPPTQDDLINSQIGLIDQAGIIDDRISTPQNLDEGKGIIEPTVSKQPQGPFERVEIDAKFDGNWEKFLLRNLNAQTPVDNDAPEGTYKVLIKFVVDIDGTVSDIKPLTNLGYGLEQEAIRVLKKAQKWVPAIQNGHPVKAYRIQAITFLVNAEE